MSSKQSRKGNKIKPKSPLLFVKKSSRKNHENKLRDISMIGAGFEEEDINKLELGVPGISKDKETKDEHNEGQRSSPPVSFIGNVMIFFKMRSSGRNSGFGKELPVQEAQVKKKTELRQMDIGGLKRPESIEDVKRTARMYKIMFIVLFVVMMILIPVIATQVGRNSCPGVEDSTLIEDVDELDCNCTSIIE